MRLTIPSKTKDPIFGPHVFSSFEEFKFVQKKIKNGMNTCNEFNDTKVFPHLNYTFHSMINQNGNFKTLNPSSSLKG